MVIVQIALNIYIVPLTVDCAIKYELGNNHQHFHRHAPGTRSSKLLTPENVTKSNTSCRIYATFMKRQKWTIHIFFSWFRSCNDDYPAPEDVEVLKIIRPFE